MGEKLPLLINNFAGGQVSNVDERYLRKNELVKAYDVRVDERGNLATRYTWNGHSVSQCDLMQVHGINTFYDRDGREWLFVAGKGVTGNFTIKGTTSRQIDHDGWFTTDGNNPPGKSTIPWLFDKDYNETDEPISTYLPRSFCHYQGDLIMSNPIYGGIKIIRPDHIVINEDAATLDTLSPIKEFHWPIMAHVVATYQNRLVLANTQRGPNFMHWSAPGLSLYSDFYDTTFHSYYAAHDIFDPDEATMAGAGYRNVYPADGDAIVAMSEWNGMLGIFRQHSLLIAYGEDFTVVKVHEGYGTSSQHAVTITPWGWVFVDSEGKGVFLWDGTSIPPKKISTPIDDEWKTLDTRMSIKFASKLWDSKNAFDEDGDTNAGYSSANIGWSAADSALALIGAGTDETWTSNVMTSEEANVMWNSLRPEITNEGLVGNPRVELWARSGTTKGGCTSELFRSLGSFNQTGIAGDAVAANWFRACPSIFDNGASRKTIASASTHNYVQIQLRIVGNSTDGPRVHSLRLNYTHGDTGINSIGKWPSVFWDASGKLLWVNAAVKDSDSPYVTRTYIWNPATMGEGGTAYGSWCRWKNAAPSCMTRFNNRTVWGVSNYQYHCGQLHILRYTDKNAEQTFDITQDAGNNYIPEGLLYTKLTASPVVLPHVELPYQDFGLPHVKKRLLKFTVALKDEYRTGNLVIRITTQRHPTSIYVSGTPVSTVLSTPPTKLCFTVPLEGTTYDRVWTQGLGNVQIAQIDVDNNAWMGADATTDGSKYTEGYAFKVELLPTWGQGEYSDEVMWQGTPASQTPYSAAQFKIYEVYMLAEIIGDTPRDEPHHV